MALERDKTEAKRKPFPRIGVSVGSRTKALRVIQVIEGHASRQHHYYRVRAGGPEGEILYHSENYATKAVAKNAAIREHEGRAKFDYVIEWTDDRSGALKRETI